MKRLVWLTTSMACVALAGCPKPQPGAPVRYILKVSAPGNGVVTSEPAGIYCGSECVAAFVRGTVVTLRAEPGRDAIFAGWQGACTGRALCVVTMDSDVTVSAGWALVNRGGTEDRTGGPTGEGDGEGGGEGGADPRDVGGDRDGDGHADSSDACPDAPEDRDGFEDADGCPDPDNDMDGISDVDDLCPNGAEDRDGFEDADGCPEPDNDRDGIVDFDDKCPNEPETFNGLYDEDGCPDRTP